MEKKLMNKMDVMEMDMVAGARGYVPMPPWTPHSGCHDSNANSMAANLDETQIDETQMKLPIGGGHKITFETQNASACVGK